MSKVHLCFIATNFNNSHHSIGFIKSILSLNVLSDVVIVDNASSEVDKASLANYCKSLESNIKVIFNEGNVGYFEGLNIGIRYAREKLLPADYYIVGNNDLMFESDFPRAILKHRETLDHYPVVSPNITTLESVAQNPHVIKGISKFREFIYDIYHSNYTLACLILYLSKKTHRFTDRTDEQHHAVAQEIYQGYGACYILGPKFFQLFSELWAPTFLMYEEFFLAKQLNDKGFNIFYEPGICVRHLCHGSVSLVPGKHIWRLSRDAHKEYRKYIKVWK
ncbi:glycosyltransferase [Pseudomonadales bacterium]|jgi:hypothetical protein|nr:glycosyltransferase [Pseudomonadales bacterium]